MTTKQLTIQAAAVQRDRVGNLGVLQALRDGGPETKASALVMGLGNMVHKQAAKGLLFLAAEVAYLAFMVVSGFHNLAMLPSLGSVEQEEVWNEELQVYLYTKGDQSILLLLYGVATILLTLVMFWIWRGTVKSAYKAELCDKNGWHVNTFAEDLHGLLDENLYRLLMTPSMFLTAATYCLNTAESEDKNMAGRTTMTMVNGTTFEVWSDFIAKATFALNTESGEVKPIQRGGYIRNDLTVRKAIAATWGLPTFRKSAKAA